jgi:hypothetical protein
MDLPSETPAADAADVARAPADTEGRTVVSISRTNPLYGHDAPLIRVTGPGDQDPVIAAIARHVSESGSVYLELPDGRLMVVLDLDGTTWVPRARDEGMRD